MGKKKFKRAVVTALERVAERCEAWEKALDEKTAELQMRIDRWNKRMEEKIDNWGKS